MIFEFAELIVFLVSIFSFGFYIYLAGQYKGVLKAIEIVLAQREEEEKNKTGSEQRPEKPL